ncbi:MAG TPA: SH3 domain-containing protein [Rhizomicrobium sp.]
MRAPIVSRKIPVDFRPLLKPHRTAGRLCLRIERLPQGAKLSAGRRGADNSWSLASDELEDLDFLISSSVDREYELTIRVMALQDGEFSTLKVVQFVVPASEDAMPVPAGRDPHGQDPVLRSQLSEMHSLFAVRESELVELRAALQHAIEEREAELAKARSDWELELDRKVAEALEHSRAQDRRENEAREAARKSQAAQEELKAARTAAEREQAKGESERRSQAERQKWQSEAARRIEAARQEWESEAGRTLEAARQAWQAEREELNKKEFERWKADSEKRIEVERRKWHAQAEGHATKERARWQFDADQRLEAAHQAWQAEADERKKAELESLKAESELRIRAERQQCDARAGEQAAKMRDLWKSDTDQRLEAERQAWRAEADQLRKVERESWKADTDRRIEAERQAWQAEADQLRKVERESWKADTERRIEAERETWLVRAGEHNRTEFERAKAEVELRIGAERRNWQMEADERAKKERDRWEADCEQRIEAARRASRAMAEAFLAEERARLEAEVGERIAAERQRLLSEHAAAAKTPSISDGASLPAAAVGQIDDETVRNLVEEREKNRQLNTSLLAQADKSRELEAALSVMTLRCETAARAVAESPAQSPDAQDGYIKSLCAEIATLRKSITSQAAELGRARAALEQTRPLHIQRGPENRPLRNFRDVVAEDDQTAGQAKRRGLVRDCIVVAAIVIPLVLLYPWMAVYLPQGVRDGIATATGGLLSVEIVQPGVPHAPPKKSLPPPKIDRPAAIASHALNVHPSPASKGAVIVSLPKNTSVAILEKRGNWTRIEVPAEGAGKPQQGWVWSAYLQEKSGAE